MPGQRRTSTPEIDGILSRIHTVAVVGLSPRPARPSHGVAQYLQAAGLRILPVNPCGGTILGEPVYQGVDALPEPHTVDVVDVFRRPDALPALVEALEAVYGGEGSAAVGAPSAPVPRKPVLWFQLGVRHPRAEARALDLGFDLVADRCLLVEHRRRQAGS